MIPVGFAEIRGNLMGEIQKLKTLWILLFDHGDVFSGVLLTCPTVNSTFDLLEVIKSHILHGRTVKIGPCRCRR